MLMQVFSTLSSSVYICIFIHKGMEPPEQTHTATFNKWDSKLGCDSNAFNCFVVVVVVFAKSNTYVSRQLSDVLGSIFPNVLISSSEAMVQ